MAAPLLLLLLLAPESKKQWSAKHPVGMWVPSTWKVVERDKGGRILVLDGPRLGRGIPHAVLWSLGPAEEAGLEEVADRLAKQVRKKAGARLTARVRKRIGPFPCLRFGVLLKEQDARARFSVALLGGAYYALELTASTSHFPAKTFDRMESSLEVRWTERVTVAGMKVKLPAGWRLEREGKRFQVVGPGLGEGPAYLKVARDPLPKALAVRDKKGPKVRFLGALRQSWAGVLETEGPPVVRILHLEAEGWAVLAMAPEGVWEDLFPVLEEILKTMRLPEEED